MWIQVTKTLMFSIEVGWQEIVLVWATNAKIAKIEANVKRYLGGERGNKWGTWQGGGQGLVGNKWST